MKFILACKQLTVTSIRNILQLEQEFPCSGNTPRYGADSSISEEY